MFLDVLSFPLQQWFGNAEGTLLEQKGLKKARTFLQILLVGFVSHLQAGSR